MDSDTYVRVIVGGVDSMMICNLSRLGEEIFLIFGTISKKS